MPKQKTNLDMPKAKTDLEKACTLIKKYMDTYPVNYQYYRSVVNNCESALIALGYAIKTAEGDSELTYEELKPVAVKPELIEREPKPKPEPTVI